ncbi:putative cysteine ligase BshC [Capnocytophaga sp. HP1101]
MITAYISYQNIRFFSKLITDYVGEEEKLRPFYHRFPTLLEFKAQIEEKEANFSQEKRDILVSSLKEQYSEVKTTPKVLKNIELLAKSNTFTITTGHQLSLFTGHLYFIFKIISVINTAKQLTEKYPDNHFVPVYWMATEDHDFEEINHFHLSNRTLCWNSDQTGATGNFSTDTLEAVFQTFDRAIGLGKNADDLRTLFRDSYLKHKDLASATHYLVNALFEDYGVVVIDGNDKALKREFIHYISDDLLHSVAHTEVTKSIAALQTVNSSYPVQVNPREVNLFYLTEKGRHRLVRTADGFEVHDTDIRFSEEAILEELHSYPERFSPNVILRPLYQEVILPNLAYIGGGGEIAYWLELKGFFDKEKVPFPMLMLRNSAMFISERQAEKLQKLQLSVEDLFLKPEDLKNKKVRQLSEFPIDFTPEKELLRKQFEHLYELAKHTDVTFESAVKAQEVRQLKGLDKLEKRLLKAQKRKFAEELERTVFLQSELFPNGALQERFSNFTDFYLVKGSAFISELVKDFNPFDFRFVVIQ